MGSWTALGRGLALGAGSIGMAAGFHAFMRWRCKRAMLAQLHAHRSIRKFTQQPVALELLRQLLDTAMRSSTNGNMQTYSAVISRDPETLRELALIHDNRGIAEAAAVVTFCADWSRMARWVSLRGGDTGAYDNFKAFLTAALDCMVLAQSFVLAAEVTGLGCCFLGSTIF